MKNKTRVGIDIDSVLIPTEDYIISMIGLFYNEVFNRRQLIYPNIEESLKVDTEVVKDAVDVAVSDYTIPFNEDVETVLQWMKDYFDLYFITYRDPEFFIETTKLLDRVSVEYKLLMCTRRGGKHEAICNHDISVLIDDDTETLVDCAYNTDAVCLIYDSPWNKCIKQDSNLIRIKSWKGIKNYFIIRGFK